MKLTPEQVVKALINTQRQAKNSALLIYQALRKGKPGAGPGLTSPVAGYHKQEVCRGCRE